MSYNYEGILSIAIVGNIFEMFDFFLVKTFATESWGKYTFRLIMFVDQDHLGKLICNHFILNHNFNFNNTKSWFSIEYKPHGDDTLPCHHHMYYMLEYSVSLHTIRDLSSSICCCYVFITFIICFEFFPQYYYKNFLLFRFLFLFFGFVNTLRLASSTTPPV